MSDIDFSRRDLYRDFSIDPKTADVMLRRNLHNRKISDSRVDQYAVQMKNGHWRDSNDAICFDSNGDLINGQHRLMAVVKSGVTVRCDVKTGLDPMSVYNIDTARSRTVRDAAAFVHPGEKIYGSLLVQSTIRLLRGAVLGTPVKEMEREDSSIKISWIEDWKGIANLVYHLGSCAYKAPGIRRSDFALAAVCAIVNGVKLETIESFIRCCRNDIVGSECYNVRAALDYRSKALTNTEHGRNNRRCEDVGRLRECERVLYAFANSQSRCRLENPYPVTLLELMTLNAKWGA